MDVAIQCACRQTFRLETAPLALIVTASNTENDMSYGSGAEARL